MNFFCWDFWNLNVSSPTIVHRKVWKEKESSLSHLINFLFCTKKFYMHWFFSMLASMSYLDIDLLSLLLHLHTIDLILQFHRSLVEADLLPRRIKRCCWIVSAEFLNHGEWESRFWKHHTSPSSPYNSCPCASFF